MTEFYKGSTPCAIGQTVYTISHPKINEPLSFPFVTLAVPNASSSMLPIVGVTNKTTTSFDVILGVAPSVSGYAINWQINIPGTDVTEYVNDKRYYSKEEIGNAKLARVHWKNVISAPDMTAAGLQKNHNHDDRYFTKSELIPVIDSRITKVGSYNPLANTLIVRDEHGRAQVNAPKVNAEIANMGYVNVVVAGEASQRVASDIVLQSEIADISGSYATNVTADNLQTQIDLLNTLITDISGSGFYSGGAVPVGTIIWRASDQGLGVDWGYADGGSLSVTAQPELFAVIGYTFGGSGDTYKKPDMRGTFARGWDDGRGLDPGRIFGSTQLSDNLSHNHTTSVNTAGSHNHTATTDVSGEHVHSFPLTLVSDSNTAGTDGPDGSDDGTHVNGTDPAGNHGHVVNIDAAGDHSHSVTVNNTGGTESRPHNIALKPFIKLFTPVMIEPVDITSVQSISGQKTFTEAVVVPSIPQAIIFGDPTALGTKALGIIGGQVTVTIQASAGIWTPVAFIG